MSQNPDDVDDTGHVQEDEVRRNGSISSGRVAKSEDTPVRAPPTRVVSHDLDEVEMSRHT